MNLKELKQRARSEGVVGFSRMKKAELEAALEKALGVNLQKPKSFPAVRKVFPEKVAAVVDLSFDSLNSWFQGMKKKVNLNLKEKAREKLLKLNAKIKELLEKPEFEWEEKPGLGGSTFVVRGKEGYSAEGFLKNNFEKTVEILQKHFGFKVKMILVCRMSSSNLAEGTTVENDAFFSSPVEEVFEGTDLENLVKKMNEWMLENMQNFQKGRSNWQFLRVEKLEIHLDEMTVGKFIPLPDWLDTKKALTNMKNENDEKCFIYCLARWKYPVKKNPQRITPLLKKQCEEFNLDGISFPISWRGIDRFERQNDISVNVLGLDGKEIVTLRKTREKKVNHVILFKLKQGENEHFALVNNINRLWFGQDSKNKNQRQVCEGCLNSFNSKETLEIHQEFCVDDGVKAVLPPPKSIVKFKKVQCATIVPFVIYADFECILEKTEKRIGEKTTQIQHHIPCSFCFLPVCRVGEDFSPVFFRGKKEDDVGKIFLEKLVEQVKWILNEIREPMLRKNTKRILWEKGEKEAYEKTDICWFCRKKIEYTKVADHCHLTGRFRGAAHEICNLQAKVPEFTPVFMHNLDGYDSHLFIKNMGNEFGEITAIPNNEEKYISFSLNIVWGEFEDKDGKKHKLKHEIRFLDSLKFMNYPLADLVGNLDKNDLHCLKRFFPEDADLLSRKGVYPYEFMDSFEKFHVTFPEKDAFFSQLTGEVSDEDYFHAKEVWRKFGMKNLGEYHDLYLKTDVFLLADVVENFRTVLLKNYLLDPAWFLTAPSFFWAAMLKMTKVKLELICEGEVEMFRFFERQIRGGVSSVFHRFSQANNKFMKDFDPSQPSKFIVYLDANSLYPTAMMQPLPVGGFEWLSEGRLKQWEKIVDCEGLGCVLEVDLEYPEELHDFHNDFPLAPELMEVGGIYKLIPNLKDKEKMVLDGRNLKLYLSLGMKLKKIWRGIGFREEAFMKPFIEWNTKLRTAAKNDFEKELFKLASNAVYGKTMENVRNRINMKLVNDRKKKANLVKKINFKHATKFGDKIAAVHMKKTKVVLDKPIFVGGGILDLSKIHMFKFFYDYVKKKWEKVQVLYSDTDSLILEIETDDFFADTGKDVEKWFDTSKYPKDHFAAENGFPVGKNKKVLGMFKDEADGQIIRGFVGLRPKCYSVLMEEKQIKKAKGTKKHTVKGISHEDYVRVLRGEKFPPMKNISFRSHLHEIFTEQMWKVALSAEDDKRIVMADGIQTLAIGHWRLRWRASEGL